MEGNHSGMLPQSHGLTDRANNNVPTIHYNNSGNTPPFGPNSFPNQFNIPVQFLNSASYALPQGGPNRFIMPIQGSNTTAHGQDQGGAIQFIVPFHDVTALSHGQNLGTNNMFNNRFPDLPVAALDQIPGTSGQNVIPQEGLNFPGQGNNQVAGSHFNLSSPDQPYFQFLEQNHGIYGQTILTPRPSPGARSHDQGIAQPANIPSAENNAGSRENNHSPREQDHPSPAQSPGSRYVPKPQIPTAPAAESRAKARGRPSLTLNGIATPILPHPRSSNIQHSPPRRAFHSPITPDVAAGFTTKAPTTTTINLSPAPTLPTYPPLPSIPTAAATPSTPPTSHPHSHPHHNHHHHPSSPSAHIQQHLATAEYMKKLNLQYFKASAAERAALEHDLAVGWAGPDANENLQTLYAAEKRLMEVNQLWDKYGQGFRMCEEEIEELWADLKVPEEERGRG